MLKFLGGGATFIQGATSIPDCRVCDTQWATARWQLLLILRPF